jgi:hypothetical protein
MEKEERRRKIQDPLRVRVAAAEKFGRIVEKKERKR